MSIPTADQWRAFGETIATWGFGIVIFGLVTMLIGVIVIGALLFYDYKSEIKFIK